MKTTLTTILLLTSLTANAGRFYYYHYEGTSNYGGLYLIMILIGIILTIITFGSIVDKMQSKNWNTKLNWKIDKYPILRNSIIIIFTTTVATLLMYLSTK